MMKNEEMTQQEKVNTDKLEFYYNEKIKVHIVLMREVSPGKKSWINGEIVRKPSDRLWIILDRKIGEVRVSISEIAADGVSEFREVRG